MVSEVQNGTVQFWGQFVADADADVRIAKAAAAFLRAVGLGCRGDLGQWALLKWGSTESRDQHDR
ncbi:hypothetical protein, partial [Arthrobacter sp. SO3]|uniref:hypothetical protein n=1 Tax=Arthrobacter sp. SO3 TaxID=1897057 RepID=UPI001CFF7DED